MFLDPNKPFSVFSNKGKLSQCDNALTAALNASLCVALVSKDGAVLCSHKKLPKLANHQTYNKVYNVCPTIGVTYAGLQPDFRVCLSLAQRICFDYYEIYNRYPSLSVFVNEFCMTMQEYSQKGGPRPFGVYFVFSGANKDGTVGLYKVDPSGSYKFAESAAAGVGYESATNFLTRRQGVLDDNITACIGAIREHAGVEIKSEDISMGVFKNGTFHVYTLDEIEELF
ncbi:PSA2 [Enterospora canceri]|uniref:PSA2 n=1 Tax=Enterospora canceri TaxID=1081671 RepID=A0A1Y1S932_9MICR|nr:PSA2 [Enterospora canceri]